MSFAIDDFKKFLDRSPTSWHAVNEMGNRLALHDYVPLNELENWHLEKGKQYFLSRNGAFCAFRMPKASLEKATILASHTDSPALKIKPIPEVVKDNITTLSTEVYGGPILSSWLNRDLAIAGKIVVTNKKGEIEEKLVFLDDAILCIPQLAIHLDREVNEKGLVLNKQDHLKALLGIEMDQPEILEKLLRRSHSFNTLLSHDLFLVPVEPARFIGVNGELLASYRLDNLASAHASLIAFGSSNKSPEHTLQIIVAWDHEEIGSRSNEGAFGTLLDDVLQRIFLSYKLSEEERIIVKSKSLCLSIDMAHGFNPNYESKYDTVHRPLIGKGIVIKKNADLKYATNALTEASIVKCCNDANLNFQKFVSRSDMSSGSTVGPITAHHAGIKTADIGIPQLSMHSTREVISVQDYTDLCVFLTHVVQNEIS